MSTQQKNVEAHSVHLIDAPPSSSPLPPSLTQVVHNSERSGTETGDVDEVVTPRNPYLSPDGGTPRRILSSHSLVGVDIDDETTPSSFRRMSSGFDTDLSPFTPTSQGDDDDMSENNVAEDATKTPPMSVQEPSASLSPPLFTTYRSSDSVTESSLREPKLHHSPRSLHLLPRTHLEQPIGYRPGATNKQHMQAFDSISSEKLSVASAGAAVNTNSAGRPFLRPPRAPQPSSLQSSPYNNYGRNGQQHICGDNARLVDSINHNGGGAGHSRTPTDGTNFTFLSALTDASNEITYGIPRRRTTSWDGGPRRCDRRGQHRGNAIGSKGTRSATEQRSLGGTSLSANLLQPILTDGESAPLFSILASNLRKPQPLQAQPTFPTSSASVTEGMLANVTTSREAESLLSPPRFVHKPSTSVAEAMSTEAGKRSDLELPRTSLAPRPSPRDNPSLSSPSTDFFSTFASKSSSVHDDDPSEKDGQDSIQVSTSKPTPSLEATSVSGSVNCLRQPRRYELDEVVQITHEPTDETDVVQSVESERIESWKGVTSCAFLSRFGDDAFVRRWTNSVIISGGNDIGAYSVQDVSELTAKIILNASLVEEVPKNGGTANGAISTRNRTLFDEPNHPRPWTVFNISFLAMTCLSVGILIFLGFGSTSRFEWSSSTGRLMFLAALQIPFLAIAKLCATMLIDILIPGTHFFPSLFGDAALVTLTQASGWPLMAFSLATCNLFLLEMRGLAHTTVYSDDNKRAFSEDCTLFSRLMYALLLVSVFVTLKRTLLGVFFGKIVVGCYQPELSVLLKKLLLIQEICAHSTMLHCPVKASDDFDCSDDAGRANTQQTKSQNYVKKWDCLNWAENFVSDEQTSCGLTVKLSSVLDEWNEIEHLENKQGALTIKNILQFCTALASIDVKSSLYVSLFRNSKTRKDFVEVSQEVFDLLVKGNPEETLNLNFISRAAKCANRSIGAEQSRILRNLLQPDKDGNVSKIGFVRSIDSIYKSWTLLLANIENSCQILKVCEKVADVVLFFIATIIALAAYGFGSLASTFCGFLACSSVIICTVGLGYLQGLLLVAFHRPFGIGDRICIADPKTGLKTNRPSGGGWIVEKVGVVTSRVRSGSTRELATISNSDLAGSKIINLKKSSKAIVSLAIKFPIATERHQLSRFRQKITEWIEQHPWEWTKVNAFHCVRVESSSSYIEYDLILQHRESWQNFNQILDSKSDALMQCLAIQRQLHMVCGTTRGNIESRALRLSPLDDTLSTNVRRKHSTEVDFMGTNTVFQRDTSPLMTDKAFSC